MRAALMEYRARLDPVLLLHTIREAQSALVAATSPEVAGNAAGRKPQQVSSPSCPGCGSRVRSDQLTQARVRGPRHWRTRKDPFEGVWGDVLVWLQAEPDATGKALMARGLAGKLLAGFCTTASRRITVVYGVIVYAIRFKPPSLHR